MSNNEYIIEHLISNNEVKFLFEGQLNHQTVTWHTHLYTCKNHIIKSEIINNPIRQFIDISPHKKNNHYYLKICLKLEQITRADILKTIIMIRQYKNLTIGKHEFG